jgi:hypothetical protein
MKTHSDVHGDLVSYETHCVLGARGHLGNDVWATRRNSYTLDSYLMKAKEGTTLFDSWTVTANGEK